MIIQNKIVITSGESIHYEEKTKLSKGQQMTILDFGDIYKQKFLNYTFKICVLSVLHMIITNSSMNWVTS